MPKLTPTPPYWSGGQNYDQVYNAMTEARVEVALQAERLKNCVSIMEEYFMMLEIERLSRITLNSHPGVKSLDAANAAEKELKRTHKEALEYLKQMKETL